MSRIRADRLTNKEGTGAPLFPNGIRVVGLTSLSNVVAGVTTFTSNVTIGGTLTYEDVTNIDSVGLITARTGIKVLAGGINAVGVITATSFSGSGANLTGIDATAIQAGNTSVQTVDTGSDGHVKMTTEGGERVRITSAGELLIGTTTSNGFKFKISDGGGYEFALNPNDSGTNALINYNRSGGAYVDCKIVQKELQLWSGTSPAERLRIGSAGQIGLSGANYGTSGQVLTSQGASAAPQWASAASVIVRDAWWSTSNSSNFFWNESTWGGSGSTLARRTGFPTVSGQQMTHSSGVWTFPSTGLWQMEWHFRVQSGANNLLSFSAYQSTNSGSSYDSGAALNQQQWFANFVGNYSNDNMSGSFCTFGNITNASTYRMKFVAMGQSGAAYTIQKSSWCMFTKLA